MSGPQVWTFAPRRLIAATLVLLAGLCAASAAEAILLPKTGSPAPVAPALRAVVYRPTGDRELLLLQSAYHGPVRPFCWLIAVPGRPTRADVFEASEQFMDAVFSRTSPIRLTETLGLPEVTTSLAPAGTADEGADQPAHALDALPTLNTANYQVSVLSPRRDRGVLDWLRWSGYAVPAGLGPAVREYLGRGWSFVALEATPSGEQGRSALARTRPVGIALASGAPVLPLTLAAVGARERTLVQVVVITTVPVISRRPAYVDVKGSTRLPAGGYYEAYLTELAKGKLVREASVVSASAYTDLHYDAAIWGERCSTPWREMWATRFWGLLGRGELTDISFAADPGASAFQAVVRRTGTIRHGHGAFWQAMGLRTAGLIAVLCLCGLALWRCGLTADQLSPAPLVGAAGDTFRAPLAGYLGRLLVYLGAGLLLRPGLLAVQYRLGTARGPRQYLSGGLPMAATIAWSVVLAVWAFLALYLVARNVRREGGPSRVFWGVSLIVGAMLMGLVVFVPSRETQAAARLGDSMCLAVAQLTAMLTIAGAAALLGYMVSAACLGPLRSQLLVGEFSLLMAATALLGLPVSEQAHSIAAGKAAERSVQEQLAQATAVLQEGLARFREDYACYPASLDDLLGTQSPRAGRDVAGNPVSHPRATARRTYLRVLPADPLASGPTTWLYDPLLPGLVESAAYQQEVTVAAEEAKIAPEPRRYWNVPSPYAVRESLGPLARALWGGRDSVLRVDGADPSGTVVRGVDVSLLRALVLKPGSPEGVEQARFSASADTATLVMSCRIHGGARTGREQFGVFEVAGAGHRLTPLGLPLAEPITGLVCSPDGVRVACLTGRPTAETPGREVRILDLPGVWTGPLAIGARRVAWLSSGTSLLVLAQGPGKESCDLLLVQTDGRSERLGTAGGYSPRCLAATDEEAIALAPDGVLHLVSLRDGSDKKLSVDGQVLDVAYVGRRRLAVLVLGPAGDGSAPQPALIILDRKREDRSILEIKPPAGLAWTDGRIIGCHEPTGYYFTHLWRAGSTPGEVVMVGPNHAPPQIVPMLPG